MGKTHGMFTSSSGKFGHHKHGAENSSTDTEKVKNNTKPCDDDKPKIADHKK